MKPVAAASRALDELRYLAPHAVVVAGEAVFDDLLAFYASAIRGASQRQLEELGGRIHESKTRLQGAVNQLAGAGGSPVPDSARTNGRAH